MSLNQPLQKHIIPKVILVVAALLLVALGILAARHFLLTEKVVSYMTASVVRADIQSVVMATGTLQAVQQVDVGAQVSGQLKTLTVKLGDHVQKGQFLAEIDPVLSQNALRSAKASLDSLEAQRHAAEANLWQSELAYRRQLEMVAKDATSQQEVESAKAQMHVFRANLASFDAQIAQAKIQVDSAQANLAYTRISAPMDGEVVAIVTQEGQTVVAAQQAPVILKLANLDAMTVKAQISEADVIRIRPDQQAYFTMMGDAKDRHTGTLRGIEPAPRDFSNGEAKSTGPVFYNALFDAANTDHQLRIGMTAQVTIVLNEAKNVLGIPISALGKRSDDGRYAVRVLRPDGAVATKTIAIGINNSVNMQVIDGLKEGDRVITAEATGKDNSDNTP